MQDLFNFIFSHYEAILSVLTLIIAIVAFIIRKKPVNSIISNIYMACVNAINVAETSDYKGVDKLNYCVGLVNAALQLSYPGINVSSYYGVIVNTIEDILSTPQKKGDK